MLSESYDLFTINVSNCLRVISECNEYLQIYAVENVTNACKRHMNEYLPIFSFRQLFANIYRVNILLQTISLPRGANMPAANAGAKESPNAPPHEHRDSVSDETITGDNQTMTTGLK